MLAATVIVGIAVAGVLVVQVAKPRDAVRIGCILPLTGTVAHWGAWLRAGIDLAVSEVNAGGGVRGRTFVAQYEDDHGDVQTAVAAFQKLTTVDHVAFVVGPETSSGALAVAPLAQRNQVVLVTASTSSPQISTIGDFIFRLYPNSVQAATYLLDVSRRLKVTKPAILFVDNDYGHGIDQQLVKRLPGMLRRSWRTHPTIALNESYDAATHDFRPILTKLKSLQPDVTFMLGYPSDMAVILRQAKELGLRLQFVSSATFDAPVIVPIAWEAAEGVIFVYPKLPDSDRAREFKAAFKRTYGQDANVFHALGYDAIRILAEGMRLGGINTQRVADALHVLKDFPGVTGTITFAGTDVAERPMVLQTIREGKVVPFKGR